MNKIIILSIMTMFSSQAIASKDYIPQNKIADKPPQLSINNTPEDEQLDIKASSDIVISNIKIEGNNYLSDDEINNIKQKYVNKIITSKKYIDSILNDIKNTQKKAGCISEISYLINQKSKFTIDSIIITISNEKSI